MQSFHHGLKAQSYDAKTKTYTPTHPYQSRPWSWIALGRPVSYFYKADNAGKPNETPARGARHREPGDLLDIHRHDPVARDHVAAKTRLDRPG